MNMRFVTIRHMGIGDRIKQARLAKGMSQDALAAAVGVSRPAVSQWEEGGQPRRKKVPAIAEALDVDPAWLEDIGGAAPMPVKGEVAAGVWKEAISLDFDPIPVSPLPDYPASAQYGLLVRGTSINKVASDSEYLVVVDTIASQISPRPGDLVVVQRRVHGMIEATVKRLARKGKQLVLVPESTDPQWQAEIPLGETDDETEIVISAIVIGKFSSIRRGAA